MTRTARWPNLVGVRTASNWVGRRLVQCGRTAGSIPHFVPRRLTLPIPGAFSSISKTLQLNLSNWPNLNSLKPVVVSVPHTNDVGIW